MTLAATQPALGVKLDVEVKGVQGKAAVQSVSAKTAGVASTTAFVDNFNAGMIHTK